MYVSKCVRHSHTPTHTPRHSPRPNPRQHLTMPYPKKFPKTKSQATLDQGSNIPQHIPHGLAFCLASSWSCYACLMLSAFLCPYVHRHTTCMRGWGKSCIYATKPCESAREPQLFTRNTSCTVTHPNRSSGVCTCATAIATRRQEPMQVVCCPLPAILRYSPSEMELVPCKKARS